MKRKQLYKVELQSWKYWGEHETLHVIARNCSEAERRAIGVARKKGSFGNKSAIYAKQVSFIGYCN